MAKRILAKLSSTDDAYTPTPQYYSHGPTFLRSTVFVQESDNAITYSKADLMTGINRHVNKRWYRWQKSYRCGFYRNTNGLIVPFHVQRNNNWQTPKLPFVFLEGDEIRPWGPHWDSLAREVFKASVERKFGVKNISDVYPIAGWYKLETNSTLPFNKAMRNTTMRGFVADTFGKKNVRKDLIKATARTSLAKVIWVSAFRGLVPIDWIVDGLRVENEEATRYPTFINARELRVLLGRIDPRSYRDLLLSDERYVSDMIQDLVYQTGQRYQGQPIDGRRYRSWHELHDELLVRQPRMQFEDKPIELHPVAKTIHGLQVSGLEIIAAQHTKQMAEWGKMMKNCIAGYRDRAVRQASIYGAIKKGDKIIANFEIDTDKRVRQLLGPCNQAIAATDRAALENTLSLRGFNVTNYWGKQ